MYKNATKNTIIINNLNRGLNVIDLNRSNLSVLKGLTPKSPLANDPADQRSQKYTIS